MQLLEALQERVAGRQQVDRLLLCAPETGARHVSAVLLRIPAGHEFALHTHPVSEDCFFVLEGSGEVFEPGRALPIAAGSGVWIPAGHPHGLRAGAGGMLEIGFQSPPDPTAVPCSPQSHGPPRNGLVAVTLPDAAGAATPEPHWAPVFDAAIAQRQLEARFARLHASQRIAVKTGDDELVLVVARGAIACRDARPRPIEAFAALLLPPHSEQELRAVTSACLLLAIRTRAAR